MNSIQEHGRFDAPGYDAKYDHLELIQWSKKPSSAGSDRPMGMSGNKDEWGYYASYKIGAEWIDDKEFVVVTAKMADIDFLRMFMTCFSSNLALDSFSKIYEIDTDKPPIPASDLKSVVSPLIVVHFINVVNRIKVLKKGYVHFQENIKKVKGHVKPLKNERLNIAPKRYDRIFCEYDERSIDIPENRLLKKALLFSQALIANTDTDVQPYPKIKLLITKNLKKFEHVSDNVDIRDIGQVRSHKLFTEYSEAIRLAKLILRHFDYSINKAGLPDDKITPFVLDMSLLYELYVYGLLHEAYRDKVFYQFKGKTGLPDFLYKSETFKAVLDAKYIPKYEDDGLDTYVIRQLSAYGRDLKILEHLGYTHIKKDPPTVPCVILYPVYPDDRTDEPNPFKDKSKDMNDLCTVPEPGLLSFYKIGVPVPKLLNGH